MSPFRIRKSASDAAVIVQTMDFLAVMVGGWVAYQVRFSVPPEMADLQDGEQLLLFVIAGFSTLVLGKIERRWTSASLTAMVGRVAVGWFAVWTLLIVLLALTKSAESFSRIWLVTWLVLSVATLALGRIFSFLVMVRMHRSGHWLKSVVLYGEADAVKAVQDRIKQESWSGYTLVKSVLPEEEMEMETIDATLKPDEIWISLSMATRAQLDSVMHSLRHSVANIRLLPDVTMYQILNNGISINAGIPMVDVSVSPMFGSRKVVKAMLDYTVAGVLLVILSPLMLAIAVAVKLTSRGPVFFKQKRLGWNDNEILIYKFRSMAVHGESEDRVTQAQRDDPRVTPLGRFLRKSSLDELPQFINVLQGRMSVVGPRPHALKHNIEYMQLIPRYALRHKVKPGITGWAQICGYRGETDTLEKMEGRIKHDIYYLEHWSLWMDLNIILMTPLATIQNKNVY
jgi:putative colanic acid biosynthesis UDP-glucose lipid carrier transferase